MTPFSDLTHEAYRLTWDASENLTKMREFLGHVIYTRRTMLGLGLRQTARLAKVDPSELSRAERGRGATPHLVAKVDEALTRIECERDLVHSGAETSRG